MPIPKIEIPDNVWDAAIAKLLAGEITRKECAELVGLKYGTFIARLQTKKYAHLNLHETVAHPNKGAGNATAKADPERHQRYLDAVDMALRTGSTKKASDLYKVSYQVLSRKVREAKEAQQ